MHLTQRRFKKPHYITAIGSMLVAAALATRSWGVADDVEPVGSVANSDVEYVEAELALIQANIAYVLHRNRRSPGYYPNSFVEELRLRERMFDAWRKQLDAQKPKFTAIDVLRAEGDLVLARMRLEEDVQVRDALPEAVSDAQINRRRLAVKTAQVWLKKVKDPSFEALTHEERNSWRIVMLRKQIIDRRIERCR